LDYRAAYFAYALLLGCLIVAGLPVLYRVLKQNGWSNIQAWVAIIGVFLFEPLFMSVLKGQDSALLLLGGLLWFSGLARKDDRLAGLGLSLTLIRPQVALVLAVPFLFNKRKVFGWFCAGAAVLGVYSFLQVGWTGMVDFFHILALSAGGEGNGMSESAMFNFTGLLLRLTPRMDLGLVHILGWGLFAAALVGLCVLWGLSRSIGYRHIALAVTLSLFVAPHLHYHDLALLAVPLIGLGLAGGTAGRLPVARAAALPMAASVLLLFCEVWDPARFTVPYLLMAVLPALTWWVETR
jgi:Glycosyltransferase family 87